MKNKFIFGILLLILFTTFIPKKDFSIKRFEIREINFEGYNILSKKELIKTTEFLLNKNKFCVNFSALDISFLFKSKFLEDNAILFLFLLVLHEIILVLYFFSMYFFTKYTC